MTLVERLRDYAKDQGGWHNIDETCEEAADRISTLEAENATLRIGIKRLSDEEELCAETTGDDPFSLVYLAAAASRREKELVDMLRQADDSRVAQIHRAMSAEEENSTLEAKLEMAREALEPFARKFGDRRATYSRRYKDHALGEENFDKMPDGWAMDGIVFSMGDFRRAREVFRSLSHKEG